MFALGRQKDSWVRDRMNRAVAKKCPGVSKNEIHMTFNVAIFKVLARGDAGTFLGLAGTAGRIESILRAEDANIAKYRPVARNGQRQSLRALGLCDVVPAEVILKSHVPREEIIGSHEHGG